MHRIKMSDKIEVELITPYIKELGEAIYVLDDEFEKIKNSYNGFFMMMANANAPKGDPSYNFEDIKSYVLINVSNTPYTKEKIAEIVRGENNKIPVKKREINQYPIKYFPYEEFANEFKMIMKNYDEFKDVLLKKYDIILLEFANSRC